MSRWKYRSKEYLKANFLSPKIDKKAGRLCMKFSWTCNTSGQRCLYHLFQNQRPHFLLPPLFWIITQLSSLSSRVNLKEDVLSYFYGLLRGLFQQNISRIFSQTCISPPWLRKGFLFMVLRLLTDTFVSQKQKKWVWSFLLMPLTKPLPQVLIIIHQAEGN